MLKNWIVNGLVICALGFGAAPLAQAQQGQDATGDENLTGNRAGLRDTLENSGIAVGLSYTNVFQGNIHGGLDTTHIGFPAVTTWSLRWTWRSC